MRGSPPWTARAVLLQVRVYTAGAAERPLDPGAH